MDATCIVASNFGVSIQPSDRHLIGICIHNCVKAKQQFHDINSNVSSEKAVPRDNNAPKVNNRKGRARNKHKATDVVDDMCVGTRQDKSYHGPRATLSTKKHARSQRRTHRNVPEMRVCLSAKP
jgi:hypothetical protein